MSQIPRIICNDDGWILGATKPPLPVERIKEAMVDTYRDTPVDVVSWCVGDHEVYEYETNVGERWGEGHERFATKREEWSATNLRHLIDETGGPLTTISKLYREAGMGVFASIRMNSHYDVPYTAPHYGEFRKQHPEWLIGQPLEYIPRPSIEWGIRTGLDYKYPGVREHMLKIICELFERFDIDGVELDFMRHPAFFRPEEAYGARYLMTDLLHQIRGRMDDVGEARGRRYEILARVPPTIYDSTRIGLDVRTWMREGVVDMVAAGGGFYGFETPLREFVYAAEGTDALVYGSLEALRWALDPEVFRALAAKAHDAGAAGLHLFNYFNTEESWKRQVLNEAVDPDRLRRLDKRYELDHSDRVGGKEGHSAAFNYAHPPAQLPVVMEDTGFGGGSLLILEVVDDIAAARADGTLEACALHIGFDGLEDDDTLSIFFNGRPLDWNVARVSKDGWKQTQFKYGEGYYLREMEEVTVPGVMVSYDTLSLIGQGGNSIFVHLNKGTSPRLDRVVLKEVRLDIRYR